MIHTLKFGLIIFLFISCSNYKGKVNNSTSYSKVEITFTGLKEEFHGKGVYTLTITDKNIVDSLNKLKNKSKKDYFTSNRPVMYEVDLLFTGSEQERDFLLTIISTTDHKILIRVGYYSQYVNKELFDYVSYLIKLEKIKNTDGISQKEYEEIINP